MAKAEAYYYNLMDKMEKTAYHAILTGLESQAATIIVPKMNLRQLTDIFFLVRLDHPEIFWSETFQCRFYHQADSMEMKPEYLYNKKQIKAHQQAMQSRIQKLIRPALSFNEREKQIYVHDFICKNVTYDKLKKPYSHEIIGPLGHGIGVCEGIAKTVKVLCDALNLWCIIPICDNNPEKGIKYRHTWNMFRFGGKYYHMDATFDCSLTNPHKKNTENDSTSDISNHREAADIHSSSDTSNHKKAADIHSSSGTSNHKKAGETIIRYDYFNVDDANFFRDHEPAIWKIPACTDGKLRYYIEKKMSFTTYEEVRKRCAQAIRKKKDFLFHWRGSYLTREVLMNLMTIFKEEAEKKEKLAALSLNWAQAVCLVRFREGQSDSEIIMEQANEGEDSDSEIIMEQANEGEDSNSEIIMEQANEGEDSNSEIIMEQANEGE